MKSFWKCLAHSTIVIAVSTCSSGSLVAEDTESVGIVRLSKQRSQNVHKVAVTQVKAMHDQATITTNCNAPDNSGGSTVITNSACSPINECDSSACEGYCNFPRRSLFRQQFAGVNAGMGCEDGYCETGFRGNRGMGCNRSGSCLSHQAMLDYFRCKFGYFVPTGGGGKGVPFAGHYARAYPVNPYYSDPREGHAYAAQGYGVPMSVPLAPVVGHSYEYGWGVPSSRLTPVSHPAY